MLWRPIPILIVALALTSELSAQVTVPLQGEGTVALAYQYSSFHDHFLGTGARIQRGRMFSRSLVLFTDYGLTDSVAVSLSVPYIQGKYVGPNPHDPSKLAFPNNAPVLDTGAYQGSFQDLGFSVRYHAIAGRVAVTPFVSVSVPSHDYPFFGHSAIGRNLRLVSFGANVGGRLPEFLPNSYFSFRYGYGIAEHTEVQGQTLGGNRSQMQLILGYSVTPRVSLKTIQIAQIAHGGLSTPVDYFDAGCVEPCKANQTTELWFHHDQIDGVSSWDVGGGFDLRINSSFDLSASLIHSVWGRNGHALRMGTQIGLTWHFPRTETVKAPAPTLPHAH